MSKALSFYGYLSAVEAIVEHDDLTDSEAIQTSFYCSTYEAENIIEIQKYEVETATESMWSSPEFTRSNFMNCFQFLQETDDANDCLPYRYKNIDLSTLSFLQRLACAGEMSHYLECQK